MNQIFFKPTYIIKFVQEGDNFYAISEYEIYKGELIEELFWASVLPGNIVVWEDSWKEKQGFETFRDATTFIRKTYLSHEPTKLGKRFRISDRPNRMGLF